MDEKKCRGSVGRQRSQQKRLKVKQVLWDLSRREKLSHWRAWQMLEGAEIREENLSLWLKVDCKLQRYTKRIALQ